MADNSSLRRRTVKFCPPKPLDDGFSIPVRTPPVPQKQIEDFAPDFLAPELIEPELITVLPANLPTADYSKPAGMPIFGADDFNCVFTGCGNLLRTWYWQNSSPKAVLPNLIYQNLLDTLAAAQKKYNPSGNDQGIVAAAGVSYWMDPGILPPPYRKIADCGAVYKNTVVFNKAVSNPPPNNINQYNVANTIVQMGGILLVFWLPVDSPAPGSDWVLGTSLPNDHDQHTVVAVGCSAAGLIIYSWGYRVTVSWEFLNVYSSDAYWVQSSYWNGPPNTRLNLS
jgi:hypothetical protein